MPTPKKKRGGLPERPHRLPQPMDKKGPTIIRHDYGRASSSGRKAIAEFDATKDSSERIIKRANQNEVDSKKKLQTYNSGGKVNKYKSGGPIEPVKKNKNGKKGPGMFEQFKEERRQHKENATPLRKALGIVPAAHAAYLLKDLKPKK